MLLQQDEIVATHILPGIVVQMKEEPPTSSVLYKSLNVFIMNIHNHNHIPNSQKSPFHLFITLKTTCFTFRTKVTFVM